MWELLIDVPSLSKGNVQIFVHDQSDIFGNDQIQMMGNGYSMILEPGNKIHSILFSNKKVTPHLPFPYPSDCSSGQYNDNILPGKYTQQKCQYTCMLRGMISLCNAVPDQWLRYVPDLFDVPALQNNKTTSDGLSCFYDFFDDLNKPCDCKAACFETSF